MQHLLDIVDDKYQNTYNDTKFGVIYFTACAIFLLALSGWWIRLVIVLFYVLLLSFISLCGWSKKNSRRNRFS